MDKIFIFVSLVVFIVGCVWYACNAGVLGELKIFSSSKKNDAISLRDYEYLFYSKKLPLGHPNAQNFHFIKVTREGLFIGRPEFLKPFSSNLLIPWQELKLDNTSDSNGLCVFYVSRIDSWIGVAKKHSSSIRQYLSNSVSKE
ncbi:MAG: hypothetical protein Alis2KO_41830 [Aliiglaciecola sp.]